MTADALAFAEAAERLAGVPFRLHGRDPLTGLDCVGLVAAALVAIGRPASVPRYASIRQLSIDGFLPALRQAGFSKAKGSVEAGDLLLVRPSPAQVHAMIARENGGFVHAHAGLARVCATRRGPDWPMIGQWRLGED